MILGELTKEEKEIIYISLVCRLGFIETGTISRAQDFINIGKKDKIKVLNSDQIRLVLKMEDLLEKILHSAI